MKKQICLTAILLFCYCLGNAQWYQVTGYSSTGNASSMVVMGDTMIVSSTGNAYDIIPGIFTSTNGGVTWSSKNTILGTPASPLVKSAGNLYTGTWGQGVYLSMDKGISWVAKNNGLPSGFDVFDLAVNNTNFYVCGIGGIFHSSDNANTWENISLPGIVQAISIIAKGDTILSSIVTQTIAGVYKSTNNGAAWSLIGNSTGLNDTYIRKFDLFYNRIFAASSGDLGTGNIYVSPDNGISWIAAQGLDDQGHNYPYNFIPSGNTIFLATSNGVYKSIDFGVTWSNTGCSNAQSLAIIGDTLFAGTGFHGIWKRGLSELIGGINDRNDNKGFTIYPNPASGIITIELQEVLSPVKCTFSVFNVQGDMLIQKPLMDSITELDISGLEGGVYILKLTNNNYTVVKKFVKK